MTQVTVFAAETSSLIVFVDKKSGSDLNMTAEGALFKGGAALAALKDQAIESAFNKSLNGKYRAAAEIIGAAFPAVVRKGESYTGQVVYTSKVTMGSFLAAIENTDEPAKGWNSRQVNARLLVSSLRNIPSLAKEGAAALMTVDA